MFLRIVLCFCIFLSLHYGDDFDYSTLEPTIKSSEQITSESSSSSLTGESLPSQILPNPYLYEPTKRGRYVALGTGLILGGTVIGAGALYLMPESFTNWDRSDIVNLGSKWKERTAAGPVVDADDWFLNWITHPYWGAVYYMQPRVAGFSWVESALYSILASSFFWEYGVEAFAEIPSWQDLVVTPAIGSLFGELFYRATLHIHANQDTIFGSKFLGKSVLLLMDPVGFILQRSGLAKAAGVYNKNDMQGMIVPINSRNGGSGVKIQVVMRF